MIYCFRPGVLAVRCSQVVWSMSQSSDKKGRSKKFTPVGIIFAVLGLLLFAYFVKKAGVAEIIEGIRRLGAGFLLVLAISGIRPVVRTLAWTRCLRGRTTCAFATRSVPTWEAMRWARCCRSASS